MIRVVAAKLVAYRSFWKFLALQVAAILLVVKIASGFVDVNINDSSHPIAAWFTLPVAWQTVFAITHWFYFIPAFFVVQSICAELELRLVRAQIIAGLDHRDVTLGWVLQNALLTVTAFLAACGAVLWAASFPEDGASWGLGELGRHGFNFAVYGLVFLNVTALCAALMRRPVPALTLLIMWPLAIEPTISYLLERYDFAAARAYLPFASLGSLVALPSGGFDFNASSPMTLLCIGYGVLAAALTWLRLKYMDI